MVKAAIDVALVGRVDAAQLAAFAFVFPVLFLAISGGRAIYTGTAATFIVGNGLHNGRVQIKPLVCALVLSAAVGLCLGVLLLVLLQAYVQIMGAEEYSEYLKQYFSIWVWTIPMMFMSANTFAIARNMGFITLAGTFTLIANMVGIACSWVFIPDNGMGMGLGLQGSAYSMFVTSAISTGLCLFFVVKRTISDSGVQWIIQFLGTSKKVIGVAVPVLLSNILLFAFITFTTKIIALYGQDALAAFGAIGRIEQILLAFQIAFTTVAIASFSRCFAQNDWSEGLAYFRRIIGLMLGVGVVFSLLSIAVNSLVASSLAPTPASSAITAFYLKLLTIAVFFQGEFLLAVTILNLIGEPQRALLWCFMNYCVVGPVFLGLSVIGSDVRFCLVAMSVANMAFGIFALRRVYALLEIKGAMFGQKYQQTVLG